MPRGTLGKTWKEKANKRKARAKRWTSFCKDFLFTQVQLAQALGISRRTCQYVMAGEVAPRADVDERFNLLWRKYTSEKLAKENANAAR